MNIVKKMRLKAQYSAQQMAEYLGINVKEYNALENGNISDIVLQTLEKLADLYHVEEYDILVGTAEPITYCATPQEEKELIPFFKFVRNYLLMDRLLKETGGSTR